MRPERPRPSGYQRSGNRTQKFSASHGIPRVDGRLRRHGAVKIRESAFGLQLPASSWELGAGSWKLTLRLRRKNSQCTDSFLPG